MPQTAALLQPSTRRQAPTGAADPVGQAPAELRSLPLQTRLAPVSSVNSEARTAELVWTTGAPVRRFDWMSGRAYMEELSLDPSHIRMGRMESGAPLLNSHQQWDLRSVLGVVERAWMVDGEGRAQVRFSQRDADVTAIWQDVVDGIVRNVSVGYIVHRYQKMDAEQEGGTPTWLAIDWEPVEVSLVPVGADAGAGTRALDGGGGPDLTPDQLSQLRIDAAAAAAQAVGHRLFACAVQGTAQVAAAASTRSNPLATPAGNPPPSQQETPTMPMNGPDSTRGASTADAQQGASNTSPAAPAADNTAVMAERQRMQAIREAVGTAARSVHGITGLDDAFIQRAENEGLTVHQVRELIFERLAQHSAATGPSRGVAAVETVRDEQAQRRSDMSEALVHRVAPGSVQLTDGARRYRGYTLAELARRSLDDAGVRTEGLTRAEVISMAMGNSDAMGYRAMHGTSDFTIALANTVNRSLRSGYTSAQRSFTRWARMGTLADFRPATRVAVAGNLALQKVNEFGEFKRGKIVDAGESIQLATYGKVVGITRQAVINDDLDMLGRIPTMFGRAAADFESDTVYSVLTANAAMSDGTALFHADHGNLAASGSAISETSLTAARKALRLQTDPSGNAQPLNLVGRYILVPAALETKAQKQFSAVVVASTTDNTNVFQNTYEIVTEPRLDASSATAWYLLADNAQIDTVEYAYLEGEQGLYTEQRTGFDTDGLEVKARLDFAAKATDWRGIYKNAGA